ncbi:hypothetical protein AB0I81_40010 [Nonomuraea sp. NPDC050404]|uniref:hypothetical protein n=1 Tax=Nonomuraea sp. NPDC050404 TaxID=3155783 RepID=UPI0033DA20B1
MSRNTFPYHLAFIALAIPAAWRLMFGDFDLGLTGAIAAGFALRCAVQARTINTLHIKETEDA